MEPSHTNSVNSPIRLGARLGVVAGIACIALTLVFYFINTSLLFGFPMKSAYLFILAAQFVALRSYYREWITLHHTQIPFRETLRATFPAAVVGLSLWASFEFLLYTSIDPQLPDLNKAYDIQFMVDALARFNTPEGDIEKAVALLEAENYQPTPSKVLSGLAGSLIVGFLYAAILGAVWSLAGKKS